MDIPIYQVDAFASALFRGNPAAICPLSTWLPDVTMQAIAEENNLAETAFYVPEAEGYRLRWFTPSVEVDLCGHATVATAAVMDFRGEIEGNRVAFQTRSGEVSVTRSDGLFVLDFPRLAPISATEPAGLFHALGSTPQTVMRATCVLCVFESQEHVQALEPNMLELMNVDCFAVIATAPGNDCDFVSRFFAPRAGIPEDPVTGSAHSTLIPYWSERLGKKSMFARQISKRGGELWCEDRGVRVGIGGKAVKYMEGRISVA
ncbi:MAG: PhzF family phenazine biosynthesis protein [Acidobacteriota bacterium]